MNIFLKISIPESLILPQIIVLEKLNSDLENYSKNGYEKVQKPCCTLLQALKSVQGKFLQDIYLEDFIIFGASRLYFGTDTFLHNHHKVVWHIHDFARVEQCLCQIKAKSSCTNNVILEINAAKIYIACSFSYSFTPL